MLKFQVEPHITEKGKGIPLSPSGCVHGLKGIGEKRKALLDKAFYGVRGIDGFTDFGAKKAWNIFFWHPLIIVHGIRGGRSLCQFSILPSPPTVSTVLRGWAKLSSLSALSDLST